MTDIESVELARHEATWRLAPMMTSETSEWYTPRDIIDRTIQALGAIDLDPCSNSKITPNVPAAYHFTRGDDGLRQTWRGRVYMNPPYGNGIAAWINKLYREYEGGHMNAAIALVPARTDTRWWQVLAEYPVCFVRGRLKFSGHDNSAPFPSAVIYLGEDVDGFVVAFGDRGPIYGRLRSAVSA